MSNLNALSDMHPYKIMTAKRIKAKSKPKEKDIFKRIFGKTKDTCLPWDSVAFFKMLKFPEKEWPKVYQGRLGSGKVGFTVNWTKQNYGFGEFCFYMEKDGKLHIQDDGNSREFIKEMLGVMVDNAVMD